MLRLNSNTLQQLPGRVIRPSYDREALQPGIVHLGVGAFHRAHQAVYTDSAVALAGGDWGIIAASLRSGAVAQQLMPQDALYSVLSEDAERQELRIVGVIKEVLIATSQHRELIDAIADSRIKIITLTITEKGYCLAADGHSLNKGESSIRSDLANPAEAGSALGILALGLRQRWLSGAAPVTLLSCDNVSENSRRLRVVLRDYLADSFPEVLHYINDAVSFPCSMVDRIVPAMTVAQKQRQADLLGVSDEAAVKTECFSQWIIEDDFAAGRPAWDQLGVVFVTEITPYEALKLGLLNASHTAIAVLGLLLKLETVAQVISDIEAARFVENLMNDALIPALDLPENFNIEEYRTQLLQRFANPHLHHCCRQIAMDSSEKIAQRWLPALQKVPSASAPPYFLRVCLSAWCSLVLDSPVAIDDPRSAQLLELRTAATHSESPLSECVTAVLACSRITANTVPFIDTLCTQIVEDMNIISQRGVRALLVS